MKPQIVFQGLHNPQTVIRVIFGRTAEDGSIGLDILVSGVLKARFYRPEDVNTWFEQNSRKNLKPWQDAYHVSGLNVDSFVKPPVKQPTGDIKLDVPYYSQRDNVRNPFGTCNVTSYAMVLAYYDVTRKYPGKFKQLEDELSYYLEAISGRDRHVHGDLAWLGKQYGIQASFGTDRTMDEIRDQIRSGDPVVVSGTFTKSGHIVCIVGLQGNDFIVNDPFGNAVKGRPYSDPNGKGVIYSNAYMLKTVRANNVDSKWAHFFNRSAK